MSKAKQKGWNGEYPEVVSTWRLGEQIPEWLSDLAKIKFIDGEGNVSLDYNETNTGGYEIKSSDGKGGLVTCNSKDDIVCCSLDPTTRGHIFSVSKKAFNLLYKDYDR